MTVRILTGHVLDRLADIPDDSVHCCLTSPPYYGLRAYNTEPQTWPSGWVGELGQEPTVALYVAHLVAVFAAVKRVLRSDGCLFVNLGDSYSGSGPSGAGYQSETTKRRAGQTQEGAFRISKQLGSGDPGYSTKKPHVMRGDGLKPKDLMLVPDRFRIAMQESGWYVRSKMPWLKRSCMPESVDGSHYGRHQITPAAWERLMAGQPFIVPDGEDTPNRVDCPGCPKCEPNGGLVLSMSAGRPTSAVEDVILFTKSGSYFWDSEAVRRTQSDASALRRDRQDVASQAGSFRANGGAKTNGPMKAVGDPSGRQFRNADLFFDSLGPLLGAADEPEPTPSRRKTTWEERKAKGEAIRRGPTANRTYGSIGEPGADAGPPFPPQGLILDEDGDPLALDVNPAGYDGAHFATFPPKLVRPLILAGTSEKGCCRNCDSPWVRVVERQASVSRQAGDDWQEGRRTTNHHGPSRPGSFEGAESKTTGWLPSCRCQDPGPPIPCTLLDPFAGSGTALMEADRLGRDAVGIDLQPDYVAMGETRLATDQGPLFADVEVVK